MTETGETAASRAAAGQLIFVLPGDNVTEHIFPHQQHQATPKLGTGLRYDSSSKQVFATTAGRLLVRNPTTTRPIWFVRQNLRRYRPALQDRVLGLIEERVGSAGDGGDLYRVNIGAAQPAILSNLSFEGATKRNRPALKPGLLVYARVSSLNDNLLEPELSCMLGSLDVGVPRKDWMTSEGCYGELRGGTVCRISIGLARELLHPENLVLQELSKTVAFEVAIGVNGFLWIHSQLPEYTILIQNAIMNSEVLTEEQVRGMVKSLVYTVEKQLQRDRDAMEE